MRKPNIIAVLKQLGKEVVDTAPAINSGGCGVYAGHVAAMLQFVEGVSDVCVRIGAMWVSEATLNKAEVNSILKENLPRTGNVGKALSGSGVVNGHLIVEFKYKDKLYRCDAHKVAKASPEPQFESEGYTIRLYKGFLDADTCIDYADEPEHWNSWFNRDQIPTVVALIEKHIGRCVAV